MAIGITDYFSFENYFTFIEKFKTKYPISTKVFFPNIELKLNESVNPSQEEVHVHLVFRPEITQQDANKFLSNLKTVKTDSNGRDINCSQLVKTDTQNDYEGATVTRNSVDDAIKETFGKKIIRQDYLLVFAAANNDGIRPKKGKQRKEIITDEIDKFCDGFFGGSQNTDHFLDITRLEDKEQKINAKPVLSGSDSHSFDQLKSWLGKTFRDETTNKEVTWIKADLTFEGLQQILIEPKDRINICPTKPDEKDAYKVIDKIVFKDTTDFPTEIKFNSNLCSIIGSRSSGKSALLNYIAHAVDKSFVEGEAKLTGPGANIFWDKLLFTYSVIWGDGSKDNKGKVVFLKQGYLSGISDKPEVITEKIEPVLFKKFSTIEAEYKSTLNSINSCNKAIKPNIERWFVTKKAIQILNDEIKLIGDKTSITTARDDYQKKIDVIKATLSLNNQDVQDFQTISAEITLKKSALLDITTANSNLKTEYYNSSTNQVVDFSIDYSINPSLDNLPLDLKTNIENSLAKTNIVTVGNIKEMVSKYKINLNNKMKTLSEEIEKIEKDNKLLIDKNKQNEQLVKLIEGFNKQEGLLTLIKTKEEEIKTFEDKVDLELNTLSSNLILRKKAIQDLKDSFGKLDQKGNDIEFGVECDFNNINLDQLSEKYNQKETKGNIFINKDGSVEIEQVREQYKDYLSDIQSGKVKLKNNESIQNVATQTLIFSEEIRFTAVMEGDSIGGFSKSSMTPGKQALFALTLMLNESTDAWPLLIDQPEDDLDSRSIYKTIAEYFKNKKKERQIIMVSHSANLVIGADSEQIIVANKHGDDRKNKDNQLFDYLTGSIENTCIRKKTNITLETCGIREHTCDILDGGEEAFRKREQKYKLINKEG